VRVKEWVEKNRAEILPYSEKEPRFGTLQEELKGLHLELTYTCNLKCRMCDIWSKSRREPKIVPQEMSSKEIVHYIQQSKLLRDIRSANRVEAILSIAGDSGVFILCKCFIRLSPGIYLQRATRLFPPGNPQGWDNSGINQS
jgi:hypothetical protein